MTPSRITMLEAIEKLKGSSQKFAVLMKHGSMSLEYYAPHKIDSQTPHLQDELYVIARGHGFLTINGQRFDCKAGDVLFVPAGQPHHFEQFSDDFSTWVIFYGPSGGEHQ